MPSHHRCLLSLLVGLGALALSACASIEGGTAGNTELNIIVPTNAGTPDEIDITAVEYTITCAGNADTFLDNGASFADEVRIDGNLEVVDGRTDPQGPIPPEFGTPRPGDGAEIWQGFMDLPPGPCNIQLRARDGDGEVICTTDEGFIITADTTSKVNLVLICDVSFQAPVGMLDVDATFSFNVGNFCPDLFVLNCLETNPPLAGTQCEVRFRDGDSTCGAGCDPQVCSPTATGLTCAPGPDPGVSTTITCNAAALLDCEGDGIPDASCTLNGDTLGVLPEFLDGVVPCVTDPDCAVPGAVCDGAGFCDFSASNPFLNLSFAVACLPPALGGLGGSVTCTAVTTDGDTDCDKTKVVQVNCFGPPGCAQFGADNGQTPDQAGGNAACAALNTNDCQSSLCDDSGGTIVCVDSDLAPGTTCTSAAPPAECDGAGVCNSLDCNAQPIPDDSCDDGNECTVNTCNAPPAVDCATANQPLGTTCDDGLGPLSGTCDGGGTCTDICTFNPVCPDDAPGVPDNSACTAASCDPVDGTCGQAPANGGGACDFSGPGSADGNCTGGGVCFPPDPGCPAQSGTVWIGCSNGVTAAKSPFPNVMTHGGTAGTTGPVFAGVPYDLDFSGVGAFPRLFIDAAQSTVPGGVRSAIIEGFNLTVEIASNGTGQVLLQADPSSITPGPTQFCTLPVDQTCTVDGDCTVAPCLPPVLVINMPLSTDCGPAGFCEGVGQGFADGPGAQCNITDPPEFCVTGNLFVPLFAPGGTATLTAPAAGTTTYNWAVDPVTAICPDGANPTCTSNGGTANFPDGSLVLPPSIYGDPVGNPASVGLNGIRVSVSVAGLLFVALQCSPGQAGGICASGEGCVVDADCGTAPCTLTTDVIMPADPSTFLSCPVN